MKICVGGTFSPLHRGHKALLDAAFSWGDEVFIGLTTDRFASESRAERVEPYTIRRQELERYLKGRYKKPYRIIPIDDPTGGGAVFSEELDGIVVSKETYETARWINKERLKRGVKPLEILVIDMVPSEIGEPIRGRLIRRGIMDVEGRVIKD
ncbi:MAG: pantetheine-phosphate adenylyltransferase [Thermoplasmata archaeon]|mgnify:CR=1 FL=1|nr:pantetheine-phosphate adenylyltransferase [Thermoplasmata archaeon]RLF55588.1 MAG: phosphopantetheine adenylyltransferase [Thermoplasmata archaeon]RLF71079.1 MAG: phosphopantetheine adenylyltransferase [Thermoplasmata archaeon]